jgi:hypothetical protein
VWTNVVFNMQQLTQQCFSSKFASIDSFLLRPCCSLRKIFTLPTTLLLPPSVEGAEDNGLIIPVTFDFPMGTISTTFMFSLKRSSSSSSRQVVAPSLPGSELLVSALQIRSRKSSTSSAARKVDASPLRSGSATSRVKGAPLAACPEESAMMRSDMLVAAGTRALSAGSNRSTRVDASALKSTALSNINTQKEKTLMPKNDKVSADDAQIDELSRLLTMGIEDPRSRIEDPRSASMQPVPITQQVQCSRPVSSSSKSSPTIAADLELELELKDEKNVYDFSNLMTDQRPSSSVKQRDQRDQPIYRNFTDSRPGTASSGMSSMRQTSRPSSARQIDRSIHQAGGVGLGVDDKPSLKSSMSLPQASFGVSNSLSDVSCKTRERLVMGATQEEFSTHRSIATNVLQNQPVTHPVAQPVANQVHQSIVRPSTQTQLAEDDDEKQEESSDFPVSVFSWGNRYYPKSAHEDKDIYGANTADYNRNIGGLYGSVDNVIADDVLRGSLTRASMTSIVSLSDNFDIEPARLQSKTESKEPFEIPARTPLSVVTETDPHRAEETRRDSIPSALQPSSVLRSFKEEEMRAMNLLSQLTSGYDREASENMHSDTDSHTDARADAHTDAHKVKHTDTHSETHTNTRTEGDTSIIPSPTESEIALKQLPLRSISSTSTALEPTHRDTDTSASDISMAHTDPHIVRVATSNIRVSTPDIKIAQSCVYDAISPQLKPRVNNFSPQLQPKDDAFSPLLQPRVDDSFSPILTTRRVEAPLSVRSSGGKPLKGTDDNAKDGVQETGTGTETGLGTGSTPKLAALSKQLHSVLTVLTRKERGFIEEFGERCFLAIR